MRQCLPVAATRAAGDCCSSMNHSNKDGKPPARLQMPPEGSIKPLPSFHVASRHPQSMKMHSRSTYDYSACAGRRPTYLGARKPAT